MTSARQRFDFTRRLLGCVLLLIATGCGSSRQADPQFAQGRQALARGEYEDAIDLLSGYLKRKPQGGLASRASFLIAKAHLGLGDLESARRKFMETIKGFGDSEEAHKSRYKLAMISLMEGNRGDAINRLKSMTKQPDGTLVPEATAMLSFLEEEAKAGAQ